MRRSCTSWDMPGRPGAIGSRPKANAVIWSVYRVKERSWYYGERLETLEEGLTRRVAVQRMRTIAQEQA